MHPIFFIHPKRGAVSATCLMAALSLLCGCASGRAGRPAAVIEADELAQRLSNPEAAPLLLLDVREAAAYAQGHVAGAVRIDPAAWKDESLAGATGLDHQTLWHDRIGSLGVNGRNPVVLYDDGRMTEAARVWFIFQHFGVPEAAVLNGGYPVLSSLIAEGRVQTSRELVAATPVPFIPPHGASTRIGLVDRQEVRRAMQSGRARILDVRTPDEYTGTDRNKNPRGGHLPGAVSLPHKQLLDEHGRLKPAETLAAMFEQAGLKHGETVITYCQSGGRASLAALAAERAGYGPVFNYYLSFGDWAADATCPLGGKEE